MFGKKDVTQSYIKYLEKQNQQLMDKLMLLTDKEAFREEQHARTVERNQEIELEKVKKLSPEQIKEEQKKEADEDKIVNMQLRQMLTGGE